MFFFFAFDKGGKKKREEGGCLRCDREVRLLISDGLRHDERGMKRGRERE